MIFVTIARTSPLLLAEWGKSPRKNLSKICTLVSGGISAPWSEIFTDMLPTVRFMLISIFLPAGENLASLFSKLIHTCFIISSLTSKKNSLTTEKPQAASWKTFDQEGLYPVENTGHNYAADNGNPQGLKLTAGGWQTCAENIVKREAGSVQVKSVRNGETGKV